MRFTFRQIEYFAAVVNSGSVAAAASHLRVSPSSISAAITNLEEEFRVLFFVRHHARGLSLTKEGKRFMLEARTILKQVNNLNIVASGLSEEVIGPIDVGCLTNIAPIIMPELCTDFLKIYPNTQLQFSFKYASHTKLINSLRYGEIGLALTYDLEMPDDISFTPLVEFPPYVLVSEENRLATKKKIKLSELEKEPFIQLDRSPAREYDLSLFLQQGIRPYIAYKSSQSMLVRTMVANDFGFSIINIRPKVECALDGSKLATIPLEGNYNHLTLGIAMVKHPFLSTSVKVFKDFCCDNIRKNSVPGALV